MYISSTEYNYKRLFCYFSVVFLFFFCLAASKKKTDNESDKKIAYIILKLLIKVFNQYALTRFYLGFNDFCSARYFSNLDEIREKVSATINHGIPSLF